MALNADTSTALVSQFKGSTTAIDPYDVDPSHGLWCQNCDFFLGQNESVQVGTRRGTSPVAFPSPTLDGLVSFLENWYFSLSGAENCYAVYYAPAVGLKAWNQAFSLFVSIIAVTGALTVSVVPDGSRLYVAFIGGTNGRTGFAGGQVYGLTQGADPLFASPLPAAIAVLVVAQPSSGVITAGTHRFAYIFITRNGYESALNPVTTGGVFAPVTLVATDGVHNAEVGILWSSIPSYLTPPGTSVQIAMTTAANPAQFFLVPGAIAPVPASPGSTVIDISITDNDLVEGTDVTLNQTFLTSINGTPPFLPSALFSYSSRLGYVGVDSSGFPFVMFSDQNAYQAISLSQHAIYLEGRQIPVQGASLGGTCYIATLTGLYSTQDNGDVPVTWTPPARVDGSVGIPSPSCIRAVGGRILLASEKGLYLFRGGAFPQLPISYFQSDWQRINWTHPWQVQIIDDAYDKAIRVLAPLSVVITNVTNTNPIQVTTAILVNGKPIAYPHFFRTNMSVTITGVQGTTSANSTNTIIVTSANTFVVPAVAGNGAYIPSTAGYSGLASPNVPNAIMTWAYPEGDGVGIPFYSLHSFTDYPPGAMALIRNIITAVDETWFACAQSNPGTMLRRVLPTDPFVYQDTNVSGLPTAINSSYETSLLPGSQDEAVTLHDNHGAHLRVTGVGNLALTVYGLDHVQSLVPTASPLALSNIPGLEYLIKWFFRGEQCSLSFGTNAVNAYFVMALLRNYYTNSLTQR